MSIISEKIALWAINGVRLNGGDRKGNRAESTSRTVTVKDSGFERACLEMLEMEGYIETEQDYDDAVEEVSKLVREQRVISGITEEES